jgi:hypothetical protein
MYHLLQSSITLHFPTKYISGFRMLPRINSDYFPKRHLCNGDVLFSLRCALDFSIQLKAVSDLKVVNNFS